MKALIGAAGQGKRMKLMAKDNNKHLFRVFGRPLIEYSLEITSSLDDIEEIIIVVGHQAEAIINTYGTSYNNKKIRYRIQSPLKGVVAAIHAAKMDLDGQDFFLFYGNEVILRGRHKAMIDDFYKQQACVTCGVTRPADLSQAAKSYGLIQDEKGWVYRLIEKPKMLVNEWMGTGNCIMKSRVLDYIPSVPVHPETREKTLADLIQCAVDNGHRVRTFHVADEYVAINARQDLAIVGADAEIPGSGFDEASPRSYH